MGLPPVVASIVQPALGNEDRFTRGMWNPLAKGTIARPIAGTARGTKIFVQRDVIARDHSGHEERYPIQARIACRKGECRDALAARVHQLRESHEPIRHRIRIRFARQDRLVQPFPDDAAPAQFVERVAMLRDERIRRVVETQVSVRTIDDQRAGTTASNLVNIGFAWKFENLDE